MAAKHKQTKNETSSVTCAECVNAKLMQWGDDPLIADCSAHQRREVASHRRNCKEYEQDARLPKAIQRFVKRAGLQISK